MLNADLSAIKPSVRQFARLLLVRQPHLASALFAYERHHAEDPVETGSLWLELPGCGYGGNQLLTAAVQETEALVALGTKERLLVWPASEQQQGFDEVIALIERALNEQRI